MTVRIFPGNFNAAKNEMVWACDKTGRSNQSDTTGNSRRQSNKRQADKGLDSQHHGVDRKILRRYSSHGTQPAGVERPDGEDHHDSPLRLSADIRDKATQGKARNTAAVLFSGQSKRIIVGTKCLVFIEAAST